MAAWRAGVLPFARRQDLAQDDLRHVRPGDAGPHQRFGDGDATKLVRCQAGEDAVEGADRRADRPTR